MARSLNSVQLIGNLTRDPELRYTPTGTAVCTIGLATNRTWTTDTGEKKEDTEFHRIVVWNKLAELCSQLLSKGTKVYFHGRLSTRSWTAQDGTQKTTTEIVADDMIILSSKREATGEVHEFEKESKTQQASSAQKPAQSAKTEKHEEENTKKEVKSTTEETVSPDDIPF